MPDSRVMGKMIPAATVVKPRRAEPECRDVCYTCGWVVLAMTDGARDSAMLDHIRTMHYVVNVR